MYFDEAPKTKLEDLYNFEVELRLLLEAIKDEARLIAIKGLRRTGKTSLLYTGLGEAKASFIVVDGREFAGYTSISRADFIKAFQRVLQALINVQRKWWKKAPTALGRIQGVEVEPGYPPKVSLAWGKSPAEGADLPALLETIGHLARENAGRFVIAFDEAQEFRRLVGFDLPKLLAYVYDRVRTAQVVVTGSQEGFLHDFLGVGNPKHALYGRYHVPIEIHRLTRDEAEKFLRKGFEQIGIQANGKFLTEVLERLNGIIGWLTYVGAVARRERRLDSSVVEAALDEGAKLTAEELEHFLSYRAAARKRYLVIMRRLATGHRSWAELKRTVEAEEGRSVPPESFSSLLQNMSKASLVVKQPDGYYALSDPILARAVEKRYVK